MPFFHSMMRRSTGAQRIGTLIPKATKESIEKLDLVVSEDGNEPPTLLVTSMGDKGKMRSGSGVLAKEAKILASVTKVIDTAFEMNGNESRDAGKEA
jgi:hypothetical protein